MKLRTPFFSVLLGVATLFVANPDRLWAAQTPFGEYEVSVKDYLDDCESLYPRHKTMPLSEKHAWWRSQIVTLLNDRENTVAVDTSRDIFVSKINASWFQNGSLHNRHIYFELDQNAKFFYTSNIGDNEQHSDLLNKYKTTFGALFEPKTGKFLLPKPGIHASEELRRELNAKIEVANDK